MSALYQLTLTWIQKLERSRIAEYTELLNRPWRLIWLNILSGVAKGVGIAIGFTFLRRPSFMFCSCLGRLIFL